VDRKPYPSDVGDEEWAFVAPYLMLLSADAPQRIYPLREVFNGLPPWYVIYQQTQRWIAAGVFEDIVRLAYVDAGYIGAAAAEAAAAHGIALEVVTLDAVKRGFVLLPRRWVVERSFGWLARFRRLARDYERLADSLRGSMSSPSRS